MSKSRLPTFIIMAYSIYVLLLPWTTYSTPPEAAVGGSGHSIASIYDAMSQPLLWQPKQHKLKGKSPKHIPSFDQLTDDLAADEPPPPPTVRPLVRRALACTIPNSYSELPSWRGLIPYSLPPPLRTPA